jgi:hypothetical protein
MTSHAILKLPSFTAVTTKHPNPKCDGFSISWDFPTRQIAKMLNVNEQKHEAILMEMLGTKAKLLVFSRNCDDCHELAYRAVERKLMVLRR